MAVTHPRNQRPARPAVRCQFRTRNHQNPVGAHTCAPTTTLLDRQRYRAAALADLYHGRWSIEELCKRCRSSC